MKNFTIRLLFTISALALSFSSHASENLPYGVKGNAYVGLDYVRSSAEHKYIGESSATNGRTRAEDNGYGVSFGYRFRKNNIYIAPEIFYDNLGNSSREITVASALAGDDLIIKDRKGAKVSVGYIFFDKLSVFTSYGFASVNYRQNFQSIDTYYKSHKNGQLYEFGTSYEVYKDLDLRLSYGIQKITTLYDRDYTSNGDQFDAVKIKTIKAGLVYNF